MPNKENHFDLLRSLFGELRIPTTVSKEVIVSGHGRASRPEVSTANRIHVCEVRDTTAVELLQERLDAGESEAIVPAIELRADLLLIDEARGRRVAESEDWRKRVLSTKIFTTSARYRPRGFS